MSVLRPLDELGRRESAWIESVGAANAGELSQLASAGISEGARVRVLQKGWNQMLILSGGHEVALDRETARHILVSDEPEPYLEIV